MHFLSQFIFFGLLGPPIAIIANLFFQISLACVILGLFGVIVFSLLVEVFVFLSIVSILTAIMIQPYLLTLVLWFLIEYLYVTIRDWVLEN